MPTPTAPEQTPAPAATASPVSAEVKEPTPDEKTGLVKFRTKNRPQDEVEGTIQEWRQVKATGFLHESGAQSGETALKAELDQQTAAAQQ